MMTKTKKKIASILVAATMLCPMCVASVSAANTTDVAWSMTSSAVDFKYLSASRAKTNSSAVYFRMTGSNSSSYVNVKVLGTNVNPVTSWSQLTNCTVKNGVAKNYAKCNKGTKYSLHSTVYEDGFSRVTLAMRTPSNDTISGIWSADSSGTYNEATYY